MWLIDAANSREPEAARLISAEERARAARFLRPALGARYIAAHAALRTLLAQRLGVRPDALDFARNAFGKPSLPDCPDLAFNLSYSGRYALIGVAQGSAIGVDIEAVRVIEDADDLMPLHYTASEQGYVRDAGREGRSAEAFLRIWTRKEACVKALGCGLTMPLNQVECGYARSIATVHLEGSAYRTGTMAVAASANITEPVILSWSHLQKR